MITRQMSLEYGLAHQIAKWGFGDNIIVGMTTRMACTPSVRSLYIRVDFDDLKTLEITQRSDWSYMNLRLKGKYVSVIRDMSYISSRNCIGRPEFTAKPEGCYQNLKRMVMSMLKDLARGGAGC